MLRVILKTTNNSNYQRISGTMGELKVDVKNNGFTFYFYDCDNIRKKLTTKYENLMGSLDNPLFRELCFNTGRSVYVFEKVDNLNEGMYNWLR